MRRLWVQVRGGLIGDARGVRPESSRVTVHLRGTKYEMLAVL